MGVFAEHSSGSGCQIKISFHGESYADGEVCPGLCSSHGDCLHGYCVCSPGWGGVDCSFPVMSVSLDRTYHITLESSGTTLAYVDGISEELDVDLNGGRSVRLCLLASGTGQFLVPSSDYHTLSQLLTAESSKANVKITKNRPVYLSLLGNEGDSVAILFSAPGSSYPGSHSSTPDNTFILIGVLVPTSIVMLSAVGVIAYIRMWRKREQRLARVTAQTSRTHHKPIKAACDLDQVSTLMLFTSVSVHYSTDCAVCLDAFQPETEVRLLSCGHVYHSVCLENLAERQQTCCVCKQDFERKSDVSMMTTQGDAREGAGGGE